MLHLYIQTSPDDNLSEIDVDPNNPVNSILNLIGNLKKNIRTNSKIHFICNNITLSHYLSFSFQGIANNSTIIVVSVNRETVGNQNRRQKSNRFVSIADQIRQKFIKYDQTNNSVDHEIRRLSDLSFSHLELSSFYSNFYNMKNLQNQEKNQASINDKLGGCNKVDEGSEINIDNLYLSKIKKNIPFKLKLTVPEKKSISEEPLPPCFNFSFL